MNNTGILRADSNRVRAFSGDNLFTFGEFATPVGGVSQVPENDSILVFTVTNTGNAEATIFAGSSDDVTPVKDYTKVNVLNRGSAEPVAYVVLSPGASTTIVVYGVSAGFISLASTSLDVSAESFVSPGTVRWC